MMTQCNGLIIYLKANDIELKYTKMKTFLHFLSDQTLINFTMF